MNRGDVSAARRLRLMFEELVDLAPGERAARLGRLDPHDPAFAPLVRLLDAHDHATERLDALEFLRGADDRDPADSSFDAAAAFAPNYAIEGELNGGGMSRVFVGRDAKLGRRMVAKVLPPELGAEVNLERFQQEIRLAAQLRHPHIVPLLESGEAAGCLYYTMPFIEGESLRDRLRRAGTLPLPVALRFAIEIADALAYAHGCGVVHRDIKPGNVLIDSGHAVVTDFGIARALRDATSTPATRSGTVIGTPAYMSPEQASGGGVIDARADVYSLGCVLHEMLYGAPPVAGVIAFTPTEGAARARVPTPVRAIIARATAARPAERFQSAHDMREALALEAAARSGPRTVWIAVAAAAVLILGASVALRPPIDHSFAGPQAVVRQLTTRGDVTLAAVSPGGAYVAFVTSDTSVLRVGEVDAGTQGIIDTGERDGPPRPWSIRQVSWSRDGSILYFLPEPFVGVMAVPKLGPWRAVIANPLLAGPKYGISGGGLDSIGGFAISPVDSSIAFWDMRRSATDQHHAVILHVRAGPRLRIDTIDVRVDMRWGMLDFSPNGRWLAACGGSRDDGSWRVALLATNGTTQRLLDSADVARTSCGVIWSARGDSLHVWPTTLGTGMATYAIDDASGRALGLPTPFRLRPTAGVRTAFSLSADEKRLVYVEHTLHRYVAVAALGTDIEVPSHVAELGGGDPSRPEISPSGDRFAYVIAGDSGSAIYTRDVGGGEPHRLTRDYREGLSGVRWSDDATRIATLTRRNAENVILVVDAATGSELMTIRTRRAVYDTTLGRPGYGWAARGIGIVYNTLDPVRRRPEVWLVDFSSGQERRLLAAADGFSSRQLSLPVWSPDGRSILYDSLGRLIVRDVATGARRAAPPSGGAVTPCRMPQKPPCEKGTIVPLRWRADGTFFSERINRDRSTTIWRSSLRQSPTLYAHLGKECKLVSMDRDAHSAVCQVSRDESDVYVVTRP
jgi:tRNA A-37 threonylcarbamoyl transferase component Bud32/WD40 repeat protein